MITKLMLEWGYDGYIRWLRGIKATYAMRRDWMVRHSSISYESARS